MTVQTNQSVAAVLRELADYAEMTAITPTQFGVITGPLRGCARLPDGVK
ncbi:MAG: hypothetical protein KKA73_19985 [Chloroflexi bacterium]|nr:hypothetical protein [Chloroflexota bacterium]MBU1749970.1 hypothetical protein [Chloroflexota bacterium]